MKIVEAFLKRDNRNEWMNLREVSRHSETNPGTISRNIGVLVENEILLEERPSDWSRIFSLNTENEYVPILIKFYEKLLKAEEKAPQAEE